MKVKVTRLNEDYKPEMVEEELKVGDGATIVYYSDRKAVTIVEIDPKGKWIKVQKDLAIRTDKNGISDSQDYRFERNPNGYIKTFYKTRKKGVTFFTDSGRSTYNQYGCYLVLKNRFEYFDYSF